MPTTLYQKDISATWKPLLLCVFTFTDGSILRVSSIAVTYGGFAYEPRLVNQDIAIASAMTDSGVDIPPTVTLTLNDGDRSLYEDYEATIGFRGASVALTFIFHDVSAGTFTTSPITRFVGVCSSPDIDEATITVQVGNVLNFTSVAMPPVRIQKRCPWIFPVSATERAAGADDQDSWWYECGYCPDHATAPRGNFASADVPYASCDYTATSCRARGMYSKDSADRTTGRYGGIQWNPPGEWSGRAYLSGKNEKGYNAQAPNSSRYGDALPMVFGTVRYDPPVMPPVGEPNTTRFEVVLSYGQLDDVQDVTVNGHRVYQATSMTHGALIVPDANYAWYLVNAGDRNGGANTLPGYGSDGDPYGSIGAICCVVQRSLAASDAVPQVRATVTGGSAVGFRRVENISVAGGALTINFAAPNTDVASNDSGYTIELIGNEYSAANKVYVGALTTWDSSSITLPAPGLADGTGDGGSLRYRSSETRTSPVWILLELLIWGGRSYSEFNMTSWAKAAEHCSEQISYPDSETQHHRFAASLAIRQRRSLAEIVRGLRNCFRGILVPNSSGLIDLLVEGTLAVQQPAAIAGSNYATAIASKIADGTATNGYSAYRFTASDIIRNGDRSTLRVSSIKDAPARLFARFQDAYNSYAEDTETKVDTEALQRGGIDQAQEFPVDGLTNRDQACRILNAALAKQLRGNPRGDAGGTLTVEFDTTFRAVHLWSGALVTLDFPELGFDEQIFRVLSIKASRDCETLRIRLAWHEDDWYLDTYGQGAEPDSGGVGERLPDPDGSGVDWLSLFPQVPFGDSLATPSTPALAWREASFTAKVKQVPVNDVENAGVQIRFATPAVRVSFDPAKVCTFTASAGSGGYLPAGTYYVAVSLYDGTRCSYPSSALEVAVSANGKIVVANLSIPSGGWTHGEVFVGRRADSLGYTAQEFTVASLPSSVTVSVWAPGRIARPVPGVTGIRLCARASLHSGIQIASGATAATNSLTFPELIGDARDFVGRTISRLTGDALDYVPNEHFTVTSFDDATGALTVAETVPGNITGADVFAIRFLATGHDATHIEDDQAAWGTDALVGARVRILFGTGAMQARGIVANTATSAEVFPAWEVEPGADSVFVVEAAASSVVGEMPLPQNARLDLESSITAAFPHEEGAFSFWLEYLYSGVAYAPDVAAFPNEVWLRPSPAMKEIWGTY